jgi:hypothetical protein
MNIRTTKIMLMVLIGVILLYDAIVVTLTGIDATISAAMIELAHNYPIVPFLVGLVCGHFFWGAKPNDR